MRTTARLPLTALLLLAATAAQAALFSPDEPGGRAEDACTLLVAVRHAEKDPAGGSDPSLSEAGRARSRALAEAVAGTRVGAVLVSPTRRARETAAPAAAKAGVEPEAIPLEAGLEAHLTALRKAVRGHPGKAVLVVGHSNTVPALLRSLGVAAGADLSEDAYGDLFVVTLCRDEAPRLVRSRFGASPP